VESNKMREKIPLRKILRNQYSYIICFRSYYILKKNLINRATHAAINIHPSPPKYRGPGGVNYALFKNEKFFGSTCYIINEKIDAGKIIDFKKVKLTKKDTVDTVLKKTYAVSLAQAKRVFSLLFKDKNNLKIMLKMNKKIKWSKKISKLKDLNKFYEIDIKSTKKQLEKKLKATNTKNFKPYITLHNKRFYYNDD
jgi:methionyl-tRNA formyltransferase|tara:strand:- start:195 stop:782 length:588 start_codon:yes stop_codon:yes gene_type:complete